MGSQVVVVTGASAGVGRAIARALAQQGAKVGLIARGLDGLRAAQAEVERLGGHAFMAPADVAVAEEVEHAAEQIEAALGPIDVWINNAMVTVMSPVHQLSAEEIERVTQVTYLGAVYGTMSALRRMRPRNRGHIIQVGSALAYRSIPLQAAYCGAKFAMRGFTDSLRSELIHDDVDVRVTMVQLPAINTPQFSWSRTRLPKHPQPVPPIFSPELAARSIVSIIGTKRREVYVAAPTVQAIVGSKFIAAALDHYLARQAYDGQQSEKPIEPNRPDNLFEPLPGDHGAEGRFTDRQKDHSLLAWASLHRTPVTAGLLTVILGVAALLVALT